MLTSYQDGRRDSFHTNWLLFIYRIFTDLPKKLSEFTDEKIFVELFTELVIITLRHGQPGPADAEQERAAAPRRRLLPRPRLPHGALHRQQQDPDGQQGRLRGKDEFDWLNSKVS